MLSSIEIARLERSNHTTVNTLSIFVVRPEAMEVISLAALSPRLQASEYLDGTTNLGCIVYGICMLLYELLMIAINELR